MTAASDGEKQENTDEEENAEDVQAALHTVATLITNYLKSIQDTLDRTAITCIDIGVLNEWNKMAHCVSLLALLFN